MGLSLSQKPRLSAAQRARNIDALTMPRKVNIVGNSETMGRTRVTKIMTREITNVIFMVNCAVCVVSSADRGGLLSIMLRRLSILSIVLLSLLALGLIARSLIV